MLTAKSLKIRFSHHFIYRSLLYLRHLIPNVIKLYRGFKFDHTYGIETTNVVDRGKLDVAPDKRQQSWSYHAINVNRFIRIMTHLPLDYSSFCFIDVGSGKGRVLFLMDSLKCQHIIGIEHSHELHKHAERNLKHYLTTTRSLALFELFNIDALDFRYPLKPTILFLFNPFMNDVMTRFIKNLKTSLIESPRHVWMVYVNPTEKQTVERANIFTTFYEDLNTDNFVIYKSI